MNARANMRSVLEKGSERDTALRNHTFTTNRQLFATQQIEHMHDVVSNALAYRLSSVCWMGRSRFGKTRSISALKELVRLSHPQIPFVSLVAIHHEDKYVERNMLGDILGQLDHPAKTSSLIRQRDNFLNIIRALCAVAGSNQVIISLDEAQNWFKNAHWKHLKDWCNLLSAVGQKVPIDPLLIIAGQLELEQVIRALHQFIDLDARFFSMPRVFSGITSPELLKNVLSFFDDELSAEYPEGSDISYSEFFLPKAYGAGWRLEKDFRVLWTALERANTSDTSLDANMAAIMYAVKFFFASAMDQDDPKFRSSKEAWAVAVDSMLAIGGRL